MENETKVIKGILTGVSIVIGFVVAKRFRDASNAYYEEKFHEEEIVEDNLDK